MKLVIALIVTTILGSIVDEINNNPKSTWKAIEYPPEVISLEKMKVRLIHIRAIK
jgi:hypothetical protein